MVAIFSFLFFSYFPARFRISRIFRVRACFKVDFIIRIRSFVRVGNCDFVIKFVDKIPYNLYQFGSSKQV